MKTTLIGLGNILLRDEGLGVHAVKAIEERFEVPLSLTLWMAAPPVIPRLGLEKGPQSLDIEIHQGGS